MSCLDRRALVLNRSWIPVHVSTVRHALGLMVRDVARVVVPETYEVMPFDAWSTREIEAEVPHVRTVSLRIPVPEVIVLWLFNGQPQREVVFSRRNLFRRDEHRCQYCGCHPGGDSLTIDHILPRSRGGRSSWANCVLACLECNKRKRDRTPRESGLRLLKEPARPRWHPVLSIPMGERCESWDRFVSRAYWEVPLRP